MSCREGQKSTGKQWRRWAHHEHASELKRQGCTDLHIGNQLMACGVELDEVHTVLMNLPESDVVSRRKEHGRVVVTAAILIASAAYGFMDIVIMGGPARIEGMIFVGSSFLLVGVVCLCYGLWALCSD